MKQSIATILAIVGCTMSLTACIPDSAPSATDNAPVQENVPATPPDPKSELVQVWEDVPFVFKQCDGQTMVYRDQSASGRPALTAVYPHPECPPN